MNRVLWFRRCNLSLRIAYIQYGIQFLEEHTAAVVKLALGKGVAGYI
jgi:hypothetical protein